MREAEVSEENSAHGRYMNIIHNFGQKPECKRLIGKRKHRYEKILPSLNGMEV
jgi:hypothetical protein